MRIKQMKVGDKVKVDKIGGFYSTYKGWAEIVGAERWVNNKYPKKMDFVVKAIAPHLTESVVLYLLSNDEGEFIFDNVHSNIATVKPTRTEYEKVTESIFDLRDEFQRGELSFQDSEGDWVSVANKSELVYFFDKDEICRKVEKEIDERQEFIEAYACALKDDVSNIEDIAGMLFDTGCRFVGANVEIE